MIGYKDIEQVADYESPLSPEMETALNEWAAMYQGKADWLSQPVMPTAFTAAPSMCLERPETHGEGAGAGHAETPPAGGH